jgi:hypothetical protein
MKIGLNWEEHIVIDEKFVADYNILVSDPLLLNSLGYCPSVDIFQLADLMLKGNGGK